MMADIAFADGAEQSIGDRVAKDVSVRMPIESAVMGDVDSAQD